MEHLRRQAKIAKAANLKASSLDDIPPVEQEWFGRLADEPVSAYAEGYAAAYDSIDVPLSDAEISRAMDTTGRITRIDNTTKEKVGAVLSKGLAEDWTDAQIVEGVQGSGAFGRSRAELIARTEITVAQNRGQIAGYGEGGITKVEVHDGIDFDVECQQANGEIWSTKQADAYPIAHPNCTRSFAPVMESAKEPAADDPLFGEFDDVGGSFDPTFADVDMRTADYASFDRPGLKAAKRKVWDGRASLSEQQAAAVRKYGNSSKAINEALRSGTKKPSTWRRTDIADLDDAFGPIQIDEPVVAYRGTVADLPEIGASFVDRGYVSTTFRPDQAHLYLGERAGQGVQGVEQIIRVRVPEGTPVIPDTVGMALQRGQSYRVVNVTARPGKPHVVDLVMEPGPVPPLPW